MREKPFAHGSFKEFIDENYTGDEWLEAECNNLIAAAKLLREDGDPAKCWMCICDVANFYPVFELLDHFGELHYLSPNASENSTYLKYVSFRRELHGGEVKHHTFGFIHSGWAEDPQMLVWAEPLDANYFMVFLEDEE